VQEYWIADPASRTVEVVGGDRFECLQRPGGEQTLASALFPGLDIPLQQMFEIR
jgi:Uma2 family endonuclease